MGCGSAARGRNLSSRDIVDTTLDESCSPNEVLRCIRVGLLCVQDQPTDRPTMSDVLSMLSNETIILPAPKQPTFFVDVNPDEEVLDVLNNDSKHCSVNSVTISVLEAR